LVIGILPGCNPDGTGSITLPKEAGGKPFNPAAAHEIPTTGKPPSRSLKTEPSPAELDSLPKAARRKG
jgi:hypothetical protein